MLACLPRAGTLNDSGEFVTDGMERDDLARYGLGGIQSVEDDRDFTLQLDTAVTLPSRYIVRGMGPVLNQRNTPYCGGYSGVGLKQHQEKADGNGVLNFDPVWLYQRAQSYDGISRPHDGTTARGVLKALHKEGCALRSGSTATERLRYRIASYAAVSHTYPAIKAAIYQYRSPVLIGSSWFANWFRQRVLPNPFRRVGGHLWLAIGWDDSSGGSIIARNSWGAYAGSGNGNFYAPARVIIQHIHDAWKALDRKD